MKMPAKLDSLHGVVSGLWPDGRVFASTLHFLPKPRMIKVGTMAGGKLLAQAKMIRRLCQQLPAAPFSFRK
jgi:hypothetical protein